MVKLVHDQVREFYPPKPPTLEAVLNRLETLSLQAEFALQRELALTRALKDYSQQREGAIITPLIEEIELAELILYCDFYPEDGQLTLIEQLRDVITEHIPQEERVWLDPLKHSYLDLLELISVPKLGESLVLRSLGDGTTFHLPGGDFSQDFRNGQVLLTRVVRDPSNGDSGKAVWAGGGIILSQPDAKILCEQTREWERSLEMSTGELVLGEWQEYIKRFGHVLLWAFASLRFSAVADALTHIQYRTPEKEPYLYAIAMYDHHDYQLFAQGLSGIEGVEPETPAMPTRKDTPDSNIASSRSWVLRHTGAQATAIATRFTLTSSQLFVECDSPERLNQMKHQLARTFGFSLHFRQETVTPPTIRFPIDQLMSEQPLTVVVTQEEDLALLKAFLEKAYLEWSDQGHAMLSGKTPRHASASMTMRQSVIDLIDEMERNDLGLRRVGHRAYDYNVLRGHVGLEEV